MKSDVHQTTSHFFNVCDMTFEGYLIEKAEEISSLRIEKFADLIIAQLSVGKQ